MMLQSMALLMQNSSPPICVVYYLILSVIDLSVLAGKIKRNGSHSVQRLNEMTY
jgi:hypothetical protein